MYNSWLEISKSAILHNLAQYQKIVGPKVEIMPVVKSNAYGHGMIEVAKLVSPKVKWLGVASLGEALELRKNNIRKRIFVLSYVDRKNYELGIKNKVDLPLYSLQAARAISAKAKRLRINARIHLKIDVGTTRVGVLAKDALGFIKKVKSLPNIKIVGIYSHFASSEENQSFTAQQLSAFNWVIEEARKEGIEFEFKHIGCSAATLVEPKSHFNMIRLGVSLYGLWPSAQAKKIGLKNYPWLN